jgi:hypothetical protein
MCKSIARLRLVETRLRGYDRDIDSWATHTETFPLQRIVAGVRSSSEIQTEFSSEKRRGEERREETCSQNSYKENLRVEVLKTLCVIVPVTF